MYITFGAPEEIRTPSARPKGPVHVEDLVANLDRAYEVAEKTANPTAMTAAVLGSAHCYPTSR